MKLKDKKQIATPLKTGKCTDNPKKPKVEMVIIIWVLRFLVRFFAFGLQDSTNNFQCGQYVVSEGFYLANYRVTTYSIMRQTTMSSMPFAWLFRRQFFPYLVTEKENLSMWRVLLLMFHVVGDFLLKNLLQTCKMYNTVARTISSAHLDCLI